MNILMGIGNTLRRDDGVGMYIARKFRKDGWTVLACGTAPENFSAVVRRERPKFLVLVDAAEMGLAPGETRVIPRSRIQDIGFGTHQLPLSHLILFLEDAADSIILIGIQPEKTGDGEELSPEVQASADRLVDLLQDEELDEIPVFE
jgi:hydrogenase 3 maturation protease